MPTKAPFTETRRGPLAWLTSWIAVAVLLGVGALTFLPSLRSPFWMDDYLHVAMVDGTFPVARHPLNLYDFIDDTNRPVLIERGMLPWWTHPALTVRFLRPLSSGLLWADHRLLGHRPLLLHLHSLLWWAAAVLAARALFRRLFTPRIAMFGAAIFALAPAHAIPLAWLANREVLISLTLGTFALLAYSRWRDDRKARDALLATLLFALAMLAGEYALCFGGYVVAIEIVRRRDRIVARALGLLPFAIPALAYLRVRSMLHYGTFGSGYYRDPLSDPLSFLRTAPRRMVNLLADGWITSDFDSWGPKMPGWSLALLTAVSLAIIFVPMRRALARLDPQKRASATWLLLGSIFSLAPVLAVAPSVRLIGVGVLGISALIAVILDYAWFPDDGVTYGRSGWAEHTGVVAMALGFAHLVHAPVAAWILGQGVRDSATDFQARAAWVSERITDPKNANVVIIRATWQTTLFGPFAVDPLHAEAPGHWRVLAQTQGHVLELRTDAHTIEVVNPRGVSMFPWGTDDLFRNDNAPLRVGDEITVPGMRATVIGADSGGPYRVSFRFDKELEDPSLLWLVEDAHAVRDAPPPATASERRSILKRYAASLSRTQSDGFSITMCIT